MTDKRFRVASALGIATIVLSTACYAAATTVIDQQRQRFSISSLLILTGDTVSYVNYDDVRHNILVIGPDGSAVDWGLQEPEQTINVSFARFGLYVVRCSIHQKMKMKIEVR